MGAGGDFRTDIGELGGEEESGKEGGGDAERDGFGDGPERAGDNLEIGDNDAKGEGEDRVEDGGDEHAADDDGGIIKQEAEGGG